MAFISAYAFVCQAFLTEKDGVTSAIRIVDVFYMAPINDATRESLPPIGMALYINVRLTEDDSDSHTLAIDLVRPDGETKRVAAFENKVVETKFENTDKTINAVGNIGVVPKQFGKHEFVVHFDGRRVASAFFMLIENQTLSDAPSAQRLPESPL